MTPSPVPDIATLRRLVQGDKLARDPRLVYVVTRRISIYLTWLVLHTPLRPNHVTALTVAMGVLGSALVAGPGGGWALAGAAAFLVHHLLDKVDGDVARFQRRFSIIGVYLDELGHGLAFAGIFIGLGLHLAWSADADTRVLLLLAAAAGALAQVLGRHHKVIAFQLYAQHVVGHPELLPAPAREGAAGALTRAATQQERSVHGARRSGWVPVLRDFVLQLSDFALMVVLLVIGAVIELVTGSQTFLRFTLYAEAALHVAVLVAVVAVNLVVNLESEVRRLAGRSRPEPPQPPQA